MGSTITVEVQVKTKGERNYFQVNIPQSVTHITGIEAFVSKISLPGGRKDLDGNVAGTIKLQAEGNAGLSFIAQVWLGAHPVEPLLPGLERVSDLISLFPAPYYINTYDEQACKRIVDSYTLYGCYRDMIGMQSNIDARYLVTLCLHVQQQ